MTIEKVTIEYICDKKIDKLNGTSLRGFFGNLFKNRPEFHHHGINGLIYKHPLIQYKIINGSAIVTGVKEGAYLLKALPNINSLELHHEKYEIVSVKKSVSQENLGLVDYLIEYDFLTPWIALNEENYKNYLKIKNKNSEVKKMLERILIAQIISFCKTIGYTVNEKILINFKLDQVNSSSLKGIELTSFAGTFTTNFKLPDLWGIGKSSSRGYGTVKLIGV